MNTPHGGKLVKRIAPPELKEEVLQEITHYKTIRLDNFQLNEVRNIAVGVYSPIQGFLRKKDFECVLNNMRLSNGIVWSIPIVLDVSQEVAQKVTQEKRILLTNLSGKAFAILDNPEIYDYDKDVYTSLVFGTDDKNHPGVAQVYGMSPYLVGGEIYLLNDSPSIFPEYNYSPEEIRGMFKQRGWDTIVAFQTRNVPHRGHEFLHKEALEEVDGLLIQPVVGEKKIGDFKDEFILASYEILIDRYYPKERVILGVLPYKMRYAGPREAIMHALIRKNYGCTHFVVGRDHAGVGEYYDPFAAQEIFSQFSSDDIGITILKYPEVVYHKTSGSLMFTNDCPDNNFVSFSGTQLREHVQNKKQPPSYLIRPEVFYLLASSDGSLIDNLYRAKTSASRQKGFVLWLTGLPQAGKTTIAREVAEALRAKNMHIEHLDGDVARECLSKDLGFSKDDRDENIKRVMFIAKLFAKRGLGVICSFVSPYRAERERARLEITNAGASFIEIFCNAPLEVCERRDSRGSYAKARRGEIVNFTGVSDPYESPLSPEIELSTSLHSVEKNVNAVIEYLIKSKIIDFTD